MVPEAGTLIYLHGFRSSSQSIKSQQVVQAMAATHWQVEVPDLPLAPKLAMAKIEDLLRSIKTPVAIVGSSLGGYYATYLACRYAIPVSIVNPAVQAYELVKQYIGPVENIYTGETDRVIASHEAEDAVEEVAAKREDDAAHSPGEQDNAAADDAQNEGR